MKAEKLDMTSNGTGYEPLLEDAKKRDEGKRMTRINNYTWVVTTTENHTEDYAEEYRKKTGLRPNQM